MKTKTGLEAGATPLPHPPTCPAPKNLAIKALRAPALALALLLGLVGCGDASLDGLGDDNYMLSRYGSIYPHWKDDTFYAALCGLSTVKVISAPVLVEDDATSDTYTLLMGGVFTEPKAGGSAVPGMTWISGPSYGGYASEGYLHPTHVPAQFWANNATLYVRFELRDSMASMVHQSDLKIALRHVNPVDKATGKVIRFPAHACQPRDAKTPAHL